MVRIVRKAYSFYAKVLGRNGRDLRCLMQDNSVAIVKWQGSTLPGNTVLVEIANGKAIAKTSYSSTVNSLKSNTLLPRSRDFVTDQLNRDATIKYRYDCDYKSGEVFDRDVTQQSLLNHFSVRQLVYNSGGGFFASFNFAETSGRYHPNDFYAGAFSSFPEYSYKMSSLSFPEIQQDIAFGELAVQTGTMTGLSYSYTQAVFSLDGQVSPFVTQRVLKFWFTSQLPLTSGGKGKLLFEALSTKAEIEIPDFSNGLVFPEQRGAYLSLDLDYTDIDNNAFSVDSTSLTSTITIDRATGFIAQDAGLQ